MPVLLTLEPQIVISALCPPARAGTAGQRRRRAADDRGPPMIAENRDLTEIWGPDLSPFFPSGPEFPLQSPQPSHVLRHQGCSAPAAATARCARPPEVTIRGWSTNCLAGEPGGTCLACHLFYSYHTNNLKPASIINLVGYYHKNGPGISGQINIDHHLAKGAIK